MIGARYDDDNGDVSGSAYVFGYDGVNWIQEAKLLAGDGASGDYFGSSVAAWGDVVLIGADGDDDNGSSSGSAYVFRYDGVNWIQEAKLLAGDGASNEQFGYSVAVWGDVAVIGAHWDNDNGPGSGSAYVFGYDGSSWVQEHKLLGDDGEAGDEFGRSVAVWGDLAVIGAFGDDDNGPDSGSAYVFERFISLDCNGNEVPDECEVPQESPCQVPAECPVSSSWVSAWGSWSDPLRWCLPQVPDNNPPGITFDVTISGAWSQVTLDRSPTISFLTLADGATIRTTASGDVRSLNVLNPASNTGSFRASNQSRFVLDLPSFDQTGGGELRAETGGVIQINGSVVQGGTAVIADCESTIELIGGAEFNDVIIISGCLDPDTGQTVLIPDGQTGRLAGDIQNAGAVRVGADLAITELQPGVDNVVLDGDGSVRLSKEFLAWFGGFGRSITNGPDHHIEGAGVLFGGLTNEGTVDANIAGETLLISAPGIKTNTGTLKATNDGILNIQTRVRDDSGQGTLRACRGEITITDPKEIGFSVDCGSVGIGYDDLECPEDEVPPAGWFTIEGDAELNVAGDVTVNGIGAPCPGTLRGGTTPPALRIRGRSNANVNGSMNTAGSVDLQVDVDAGVVLRGDFDNRATAPGCFAWNGKLTLIGGTPETPQIFEVAGKDLGHTCTGFENNFAIGTLELAPGAVVKLVDQVENQLDGQTFPEALYVNDLIINAGAQLNLNGLNIYYNTLDGEPPVLPDACICGDMDGDGEVTLNDFTTFARCFGLTLPTCGCPPEEFSCCDLDGDGEINLSDFVTFAALYGQPSTNQVPNCLP